MTLTLEIPNELEQELSTEAAQLGVSLPEYVLRLLSFRPPLTPTPQTGADLVVYWREAGLVGTRTDIADSQQYARKLRATAEKRELGDNQEWSVNLRIASSN